jgi:hypothetical protein
MNKSGETILRLRSENQQLIKSLADILEWAIGNKGSKHINPYCVPEINNAFCILASITNGGNFPVNTKKLSGVK